MPTLAELQNPYASLSLEECAQDELAKHDLLARLQNPYATLEIFGEPEPKAEGKNEDQLELPEFHKDVFVSKSDFVARSRAIFLQYEPMRANRRILRPEFREFMENHKTKSGRIRAEILEDLKRFDISVMGALNPHLNRESSSITQKLEKISRKYSVDN